VQEVRRLTDEYGPSAMVGDGINDAPARATATVGVAMGAHGTGNSAEAADVVFLVDDVTKVGDGVGTGQRMLRVAKQSIYFGIGGALCPDDASQPRIHRACSRCDAAGGLRRSGDPRRSGGQLRPRRTEASGLYGKQWD
jgi:hypothetical protein